MSSASDLPYRMTLAEFEQWAPPFGLQDRRWELVDGEPVCERGENTDQRLGLSQHPDPARGRLSSTDILAEVLRRDAEAAWPERPEMITGTQQLRLDSIWFEVASSDLYVTSSLV